MIEPRARSTDPHTSHVAAMRARNFADTHANRIVEALKEHGRMSAQGIAGMTGLSVEQVDRRTVELQRKGLIAVVQLDGRDLVWSGYRVWGSV